MPQSNVVITGVGVVSSIGIGADPFFQALLGKCSGITSLANRSDNGPKPDRTSKPPGLWIGGPVIDFDPKQHVRPRKALKVMCREIQFAFAASQLAIEHAGLEPLLPATDDGPLAPSSVGTVFGAEIFYGPPIEMEDAIRDCLREDGTVDPSRFGNAAMKHVMPLWMLKYLPNMPACHVGISINAQGPNNSLVLGDVSGPAALIEASNCLERGLASIMLSGACGTRIGATRMNYTGDLPIAEVYRTPDRSARPFDPQSRGVVGGEAAATLVLETREQVEARNGKPLARLCSYASRFVPSRNMHQRLRSTARDQIEMRGSQKAIELAMLAAIEDAAIDPSRIGLVISHAMGDPSVDHQERQALATTLPGVPVTATIAALGHTGAASSMIDVATGVLAIAHHTIPPTATTDTTPTDVGLLDEAAPLREDHVLVISHTTSGHATAIILATP